MDNAKHETPTLFGLYGGWFWNTHRVKMYVSWLADALKKALKRQYKFLLQFSRKSNLAL